MPLDLHLIELSQVPIAQIRSPIEIIEAKKKNNRFTKTGAKELGTESCSYSQATLLKVLSTGSRLVD